MREGSPTLERWRRTTTPTPETDPAVSYWPDGHVDELTAGPEAEAAEERFTAAIELRRWPDRRPVTNGPPPGWPMPLGDAAFHGLAGDIVRSVSPYTEASDEALLLDLLATFGIMAGKGPYFRLGGSQQQPRLNIIIVGDTARGRKGAARDTIHTLVKSADPKPLGPDLPGYHSWTEFHYLKGLTSGEGLIFAMNENGSDGRMLIVESEFGRLITSAAREGSTLSPIIRDAFDTNSLRVANKNSPVSTSTAYVGIVANITQGELMGLLDRRGSTEAINGFGNRFLYVASRRTHLIPTTAIPTRVIDESTALLRDLLRPARRIEEMHRTKPASKLWDEWYYSLSEPDGLYGSMTARLDVLGIRLSMLYAMLDGTKAINTKHVEASFEVIRYCDESAKYIIGDATGSPIADKLLRALRLPDMAAGTPTTDLTRAQQFKLFDNHITVDELNAAVSMLVKSDSAEEVKIDTAGRPRQVLRAL